MKRSWRDHDSGWSPLRMADYPPDNRPLARVVADNAKLSALARNLHDEFVKRRKRRVRA